MIMDNCLTYIPTTEETFPTSLQNVKTHHCQICKAVTSLLSQIPKLLVLKLPTYYIYKLQTKKP
uniref:Uncharacterized protein n=1 Tax=Arion vulgaris TaxID=1028688 RepID=A0A0B7ALT6_9EUPU